MRSVEGGTSARKLLTREAERYQLMSARRRRGNLAAKRDPDCDISKSVQRAEISEFPRSPIRVAPHEEQASRMADGEAKLQVNGEGAPPSHLQIKIKSQDGVCALLACAVMRSTTRTPACG